MEEKVIRMLEGICETEGIAENKDMDLFDAGLIDSLGFVDLLVQIEENFGLSVAPTDVDKADISSVNKLTAFLRGRGVN